MIVHEESLFGTGTANLLAPRCRGWLRSSTSYRQPDARLQQHRAAHEGVNPDILIPANYCNEYALLLRTMKQQGVAWRLSVRWAGPLVVCP
jgi:branched-chain amino acid transport system substrate-binding protein